MKKLLVSLLVLGILASCNNNKTKGGGLFGGIGNNKNTNRNKDDYGNNKDNNGNNGNKEDDRGGNPRSTWAKSDESTFLNECNTNIGGSDEGKQVCSCILGKLEQSYRSLDEADQMGGPQVGSRLQEECTHELENNNGGNEFGKKKLDGNDNGGDGGGGGMAGRWTNQEREALVDACVNRAVQGGSSRSHAQSYCSCMQEKLERIYPSAKDVDALTQADMQTTEFKQMIQDCQP